MKPKQSKRRWLPVLLSVPIIAILLTALAGIMILLPYSDAKMDMTLMNIPVVHEPSVLYAYDPTTRQSRSGNLHVAPNSTLSEARPRVYTPYEDIPADLIHAFVAIEDKRFWEHDGIDLIRTSRAGLHYLTGNADFGGSTITQQLIKNLTGNDRHTLDRKLTEIFQALDLEQQTDKTHILEAYLNVINLSEGCYGVGAASERYFSKSVRELTLAECASIAAITNNPALYNPITHPENNRSRRNVILRAMADQGYITPSACEEATASALTLHPAPTPEPTSVTSWYTDLVVSDVIRDLQQQLGYSYESATLLVYRGGLSIETAMDERMQQAVERYYTQLSHFPTGETGRPQSSCILIDPATGDILAVAGAVGEKNANRLQNYATDTKRPAGSCIKPLTVYAPALEEGLITWASIYQDSPVTELKGTAWPANADGQYRGPVTVGKAVAQSLNPVAVRILEQVGREKAFSFARNRLGMTSLIPAQGSNLNDLTLSSLALGQQSRGVTVRELTAAYTAFSDGIYRAPVSYHRVLDKEGNVLLENRPANEANRALSPENAALMTRLLMTVTATQEGTASRYITLPSTLGIETAGKTGTTQNNCDRWFIGYTPRLLAGVWMGYDYPSKLKGIHGNPCVTIWDDLMKTCEDLYRGAPAKYTFDTPESLIQMDYCPLSGMLPNPYCSDPVYNLTPESGWFIRGIHPHSPCQLHEEPPIRTIPQDPADPDRIPLLPGDLIEDAPHAPSSPKRVGEPWYKRYGRLFSHFGETS